MFFFIEKKAGRSRRGERGCVCFIVLLSLSCYRGGRVVVEGVFEGGQGAAVRGGHEREPQRLRRAVERQRQVHLRRVVGERADSVRGKAHGADRHVVRREAEERLKWGPREQSEKREVEKTLFFHRLP